jgi:hypothetical protein
MVYNRGSRDDFDRYAKVAGSADWSWDSIIKNQSPKNEKIVAPNDGHNFVSHINALYCYWMLMHIRMIELAVCPFEPLHFWKVVGQPSGIHLAFGLAGGELLFYSCPSPTYQCHTQMALTKEFPDLYPYRDDVNGGNPIGMSKYLY